MHYNTDSIAYHDFADVIFKQNFKSNFLKKSFVLQKYKKRRVWSFASVLSIHITVNTIELT